MNLNQENLERIRNVKEVNAIYNTKGAEGNKIKALLSNGEKITLANSKSPAEIIVKNYYSYWDRILFISYNDHKIMINKENVAGISSEECVKDPINMKTVNVVFNDGNKLPIFNCLNGSEEICMFRTREDFGLKEIKKEDCKVLFDSETYDEGMEG